MWSKILPDIALVEPDLSYADRILDYRSACLGEPFGVHGAARLDLYEDVEAWLAHVASLAHPTEETGVVPSSQFLAVRSSDGRLVGTVNIRYALNDFWLNFGGHIGYMVRPDERRKGYAACITQLALDKLRAQGVKRALITCVDTNEASRRTILKAGGIYEDTRTREDGSRMERYWIEVPPNWEEERRTNGTNQ